MARGTAHYGVPLTLALATIVLSLIPLTAQQPFSSGTNLVVVPVVALDRKGATVADLTASDFQITEDGEPVAIQTFVPPSASEAAEEQGRFIVVLLDNLLTAPELGFRVKNIARMFVDRMGAGDVMSVIPINGGRAITTMSKMALTAAIEKFTPSLGEGAWQGGQKVAHGLRMINALSEQVSRANHRRKVLVFIGDAGMFSPSEPSAFDDRGQSLSPEWLEAISATSRNNVTTYLIDPKGLEAPVGDWSQSFAAETGGYAWSRTNNYRQAVDRIWHESASYYLIGYSAPTSDRKIHKIGVKVSRGGVTIRARRARG